MSFKAPSIVEVSGDFASGTLAAPEACMDVRLTMPGSCFLQKDHLNHQYHAKRAMYLATVAAALKQVPAFQRQHWEYKNNDPR